jgi:23S rRNA (adenine2503-C2)-methyltransferase
MDLELVAKTLTELGQPKYRLTQIKKAVFQQMAEKFSDIKELPSDLAKELDAKVPLYSFRSSKIFHSKSGESAKALFEFQDGKKAESVLMFHNKERITICVSSQIGCAMSCGFCATGRLGFERNLTSEEITDQVLFWDYFLKKDGKKTDNVVFMGMGEPFLNYDNVISAIRLLNDHTAFNIGQRHLSVSTAGVVPGIEKFADEKLQVNLAISLHAVNDETRSKIMPINQKYPLESLMTAAKNYVKKTNRRLMFEYLLMDGLNDSESDAKKLAKMMSENKLYFVNLILYNETGIFNPPSKERTDKFKKVLQNAGIDVIQRRRFGEDIAGACGQLAAENA